ncbi:HAD family phosphatase [archaeon]|nr:HAD family phosphatase [archaeon]
MKAIIFDMDGVIADTERAYLEACNKLLKKFGIEVNKDDWFNRYPGTGTTYILSTIFKENNIKPSEGLEYWLEKWKTEYSKFVKNGKIKPVKGFLEFNKHINALGIKKIIATGSHKKNAYLVLKTFGIEKEFEIVGLEDVTEGKPNPEIFLEAAKRIGYSPENCVVFEDAVVGVQAAKAAGMECVAMTTSMPEEVLRQENPDWLVKDYTELEVEKIV